MGKITVKHFINVNLRPYIVGDEKLYPPYLLITVNRKTTKVKSHSFSELQSPENFKKHIRSKEASSEVLAVTDLITSQVSVFNENFDTNLFSSFYNLMPEYPLINSQIFERVMSNTKLKNDWSDLILGHKGSNPQSGLTFFDWYKPEFQNENKKQLSASGLTIKQVNQIVLISFFEFLQVIARSQQKYNSLLSKYPLFFEDAEGFALSYASLNQKKPKD